MLSVTLGIFSVLLVRLVRFVVYRVRQKEPESICGKCIHAHVHRTAKGREAIFCIFGGPIRAMKTAVLHCTDFNDRNDSPRRVRIGYHC